MAQARHYNEWLFDRARPYVRGRVLDAGAGIGTHTARALDVADAVVALEPDPPFAQRLRERFGERVRVVLGGLDPPPADPALDAPFDAVLCFNVLEHVRDDRGALAAVARLLAPGGNLLLLVPAHQRLFGATDHALGHERRYSRDDLGEKLHDAGLEPRELRYVNPVGALGWLVGMRLRRSAGWPSRSFGLFDRAVPLLRPLDRLRLPFGLSVWAVATRRT